MRLMLLAGEVSGDHHAAALLRALRALEPDLQVFGAGGEALAAEGMDIRYHVRDLAVMGIAEVLSRYAFFRRAFGDLLALAAERRPDAVILVDYPGFNLRFAPRARALGLRTVYYIAPQVWAWNRRRIPGMARNLDLLLAIFPFEPAVFAGTGLRVEYVGHPLLDETRAALALPREALPWGGAPGLALLPGSRRHEVTRILPLLLDALQHVRRARPDTTALLASASPECSALARDILARHPAGATVGLVEGRSREVARQARAALVASGTATLETALMGCPLVVTYRMSVLTYLAARSLVRVPHIGMVNLVAGRRLCPELVQRAATGPALAAAVLPLLEDTPARAAMLAGYASVARAIGPEGAADRAARRILDLVRRESR